MSEVIGILGLILAVGSAILAWRKKLLSTGFETFKQTYRIEMDDFKTTIRNYINQNEERHSKTLNRIVELYENTHNEVTSQTNICKVIQARREGNIKFEEVWKKQIEDELNEVREDVRHIKKVINHADLN